MRRGLALAGLLEALRDAQLAQQKGIVESYFFEVVVTAGSAAVTGFHVGVEQERGVRILLDEELIRYGPLELLPFSPEGLEVQL